jgi:hypothetical protein
MTTRRTNSDLNAEESRSHKYRKVQFEFPGQAHRSKEHKPQPDEGVSSSGILLHADPVWKANHTATAEGPLVKPSIEAVQHAPPNLDPGLGQLSLLSPEIRDLIYELIPVEGNPDIASPCQPKELRHTSKSFSRDLHRSSRPCTHIDFTFTCDVSSKEVIEDRYRWLQSRLARGPHAHNLQNVHRVEIIVKDSAIPELPSLCYRLVCIPPGREVLHIWFDGPRAGHARLCKFQDQLAGSFEAATMCINATMEMMRALPSQTIHASAVFDSTKANDDMLSALLRYYAAPQAEERKGPAGKPALCFIACTNPGNELLEYHFHPTAQHRLRKLVRDGFVIRNCELPLRQSRMEFDLFDCHHEFFDSKAEWEGRSQGEDWLAST